MPGHEVHTVEWAGFKGLSNGHLLREAEQADYAVFVTVDRGISHQQNRSGQRLSLLIIRAETNQLEHLIPLAPAIRSALAAIQPGESVRVP